MLYLDNSATTRIDPEVVQEMWPYLNEEYGNPSSKYYSLAENAKKAVETARQRVSELAGCDPDEVIFTSGAMESNNMVIKGVADYYRDKGNHIVTSKTEHPSVLETCRFLETRGFKVTYLDVDRFGRVSPEQVQRVIEEDPPILVSLIWGNNEVGSLNPIREIAEICCEYGVFFHTDATQVMGKVEVNLKKLPGIRFLSFSGHKIYGPKGIGVCIIRKEDGVLKTHLTPLMHGGSQENGYRSGTLAVHNIVGIGKAAELARLRLEENRRKLQELETHLVNLLKEQFGEKVEFNNDEHDKIPGILSVRFVGSKNNEILIKQLAPYMALSTGSACSSGKPSHVLQAMGKTIREIQQTVRISLSPYLKKEDLDLFKQLK
jgi:cysteine desulfurase